MYLHDCDCDHSACFGLPVRPSRCGACGGAGCGAARYGPAPTEDAARGAGAARRPSAAWLIIAAIAVLAIGGKRKR